MPKEIGNIQGVVELDNGEKLYDPTDFKSTRRLVYDDAKKSMEASFPHEFGGFRLALSDVDYADAEDRTVAEERAALMGDEFLGRRLRGTVSLYKSGEDAPIDSKKMTLMKVPHITDRGTIIHGGNDYGRISQFRLLPGAYARVKANGDLETQINPKVGTGSSLRVRLEPSTAIYKLETGGSNLHFYSVLKGLGVTDTELKKSWGDRVWKINADAHDDHAMDRAYTTLVRRRDQIADAPPEQRLEAIRNALNNVMLHRDVINDTLPGHIGGVVKTAYENAIMQARVEICDVEFKPDKTIVEDFVKAASEFGADLGEADMQKAHEAIHARNRPQLASMRQWPASWIPAGSNALGWIDWYMEYLNGRRTGDDERQINRWRRFKARSGAAFMKNPTPRAAFALRNWAIDPVKLLKQKASKDRMIREMSEYEKGMNEEFERKDN